MSIYEVFVQKVSLKGIPFDGRTTHIFVEYLKSYSFNSNVLPLNHNGYFKEKGILGGQFDWPAQELQHSFYTENIEGRRIGVPQGCALSCLMANLMLHYVDDLVLLLNESSNILYLRFCDDMIILSASKEECQEALARYLEGIRNCNLLAHVPKRITSYDCEFWNSKSKLPYKWADRYKGGIP